MEVGRKVDLIITKRTNTPRGRTVLPLVEPPIRGLAHLQRTHGANRALPATALGCAETLVTDTRNA